MNWFECVRTALADADSRLASFLGAGRPDYSFLPSCSSQYTVHGDFAQGLAVPVNPSLLALFERPLHPSLQLGLTIREAVALEASFRAHSVFFPFLMVTFRSLGVHSPPGFYAGCLVAFPYPGHLFVKESCPSGIGVRVSHRLH